MVRSDDGGDGAFTLRQRKSKQQVAEEVLSTLAELKEGGDDKSKEREAAFKINPGSYWFTRILFLRSLSFIYGIAFLIAYHQNKELVGDNGLLPQKLHMDMLSRYFPDWRFLQSPSLLWFAEPWTNIDGWLDAMAIIGLVMSAVIFITGAANALALTVLWILYQSLVNSGQRFYGFGWESQLLETGFLAIWIVPALSWKALPPELPSPSVAVWGYRWLIFRIMIGAGLIKIRGDVCWRRLTCMNYHYETQPVPNPVAYYLHQMPVWWHMTETMGNHIVELVVPWFMLLNRPFQIVCGVIQIMFQVILIISGNLSFLNWLTIIPSIWFFDDAFLCKLFGKSSRMKVIQFQQEDKARPAGEFREGYFRKSLSSAIGILIAVLSVPVIVNLLSTRQAMNTSFEPFRLVNTYGAFGSVTKKRSEVILQGTYDEVINADTEWLEYEFKCKPGDLKRRPCAISPYHYRLDWLMWFAAFQDYQSNPWLVHLIGKLLVNDKNATSLIERNPFEDDEPPIYIRAQHYLYTFSKIGSKEARQGVWWNRRLIGEFMPPQSLTTIKQYFRRFGWKVPKSQ